MAEPVETPPRPGDSAATNADGSLDCEDEGPPMDIGSTPFHLPFKLNYAERLTIDSHHSDAGALRHVHFAIDNAGPIHFQPLSQSGPQVRNRHHQPNDDSADGFSFTMSSIEMKSTVHRQLYVQARHPQAVFEESGDTYVPFVQISNRAIRQKLIKICDDLAFLDKVFAECFRAFEHAFDNDIVRESLVQIRKSLAKRQRRDPTPTDTSPGYIGNLGEFCEKVCASWKQTHPNRKIAGYKSGLKYGSDCPVYLQDTLEIPYWQLIMDLFLDWRESNINNMLATAILHTIQYRAISCQKKADELRRLAPQHTEDRKGLEVLLDSIQKRLDFLTDALELSMPRDDKEENVIIATCVCHTESMPAAYSHPPGPVPRNVAPTQVALFVFFVILAIIPGYQGFANSQQSTETGTVTDADFYFLMQSTLMSVLGSFATALPLLSSSKASSSSHYFYWAFAVLGMLSAIASVIIYPFTNTGWSAMVAFVSTVASATSTLILVVATAREPSGDAAERNGGGGPGHSATDGKRKTE